jgi:hypothetical protein
MKDFESLSHVRWECKYHVVFIPASSPEFVGEFWLGEVSELVI